MTKLSYQRLLRIRYNQMALREDDMHLATTEVLDALLALPHPEREKEFVRMALEKPSKRDEDNESLMGHSNQPRQVLLKAS